jgi:hypothetical protein
MRNLFLLMGVFWTVGAGAAERMEVLICNTAGVPEYVLARAETEADIVFRQADIDVKWSDCQSGLARPHDRPWFVIRLRVDRVPHFAGDLSLHAMGRAFVSEGEDHIREGYIADVYCRAVRALSESTQTDMGPLVGYTIAHEIGHLLLGPGHRAHGIMRATWGEDELRALSQRYLGFDKADRVRLREGLRQNLSRP